MRLRAVALLSLFMMLVGLSIAISTSASANQDEISPQSSFKPKVNFNKTFINNHK